EGAEAQRTLGGLVVTFQAGALNDAVDKLPPQVGSQLKKHIDFNQTITYSIGAVSVDSATLNAFAPPPPPPPSPPAQPPHSGGGTRHSGGGSGPTFTSGGGGAAPKSSPVRSTRPRSVVRAAAPASLPLHF